MGRKSKQVLLRRAKQHKEARARLTPAQQQQQALEKKVVLK